MKKYIFQLVLIIILAFIFLSFFKSCRSVSCSKMYETFSICMDKKILELDKTKGDLNDLIFVIDDCQLNLIHKYD